MTNYRHNDNLMFAIFLKKKEMNFTFQKNSEEEKMSKEFVDTIVSGNNIEAETNFKNPIRRGHCTPFKDQVKYLMTNDRL